MRAHEFIIENEVEEGWKDVAIAGAATLGLMGAPKVADAGSLPQPAKQEVRLPTLSDNPQYEKLLQRTAKSAGIAGTELAQFLAQTKHESWDFSRLKEKGGSLDFRKYDIKYNPQTAKILGNIKPGDGTRYHGRGFIQLTGRDNYRRAGQALHLPLEKKPDLAQRPDIAAKIAVWYWQNRVAPYVQNFNDTTAVTKRINPNLRGLDSRQENFKDYLKIV